MFVHNVIGKLLLTCFRREFVRIVKAFSHFFEANIHSQQILAVSPAKSTSFLIPQTEPAVVWKVKQVASRT